MTFDVVVAWLLSDPHSVELQTASYLLLTFEHHQRHLHRNSVGLLATAETIRYDTKEEINVD